MSNSEFSRLQERELPENRKKIVDELVKHLEKGDVPWNRPWGNETSAPYNAITGKPYRGINLLSLCVFSNFSDPRWCTFKQLAEKKWHLIKGSKGTPIEVFKQIDKRTKKDVDWKEVNEEIKDMGFEERQEFFKKNIQTFIKIYHIFNAEQIEGIPKLERHELSADELEKRNERVDKIISNSQSPIFYDGGNRNYYDILDDSIHLTELNNFHTIEGYYAVALHEIGHSTGHSSRLNRQFGRFGTTDYAREELRAELGSVFLLQDLGIPDSEKRIANHAGYIDAWISWLKEKPQELFAAISDANKIAAYVKDYENVATKTTELSQEQLDVAAKHGFSAEATARLLAQARANTLNQQPSKTQQQKTQKKNEQTKSR